MLSLEAQPDVRGVAHGILKPERRVGGDRFFTRETGMLPRARQRQGPLVVSIATSPQGATPRPGRARARRWS